MSMSDYYKSIICESKSVLKACPFCGKVDSVVLIKEAEELYYVGCIGYKGGCGAHSLMAKSDIAEFWWNKRA